MLSQSLLSMVLAVAAVEPHTSETFEDHFCDEAMSIYLPSPQGEPAPNIELNDFQYMSPDDRCGHNIANAELMRLHAAIKPIAAKSFGDSKSRFAVMVRYTLSPDKPATFEMRVQDAPKSENDRLTAFYERSSALTDFHSESGTVYVVFHYGISPGRPGSPKAGAD